MSVANQRSTPEGAKVNGSPNSVKERCFALLSMTNNIWVNIYIITNKNDNLVRNLRILFWNLMYLCPIIRKHKQGQTHRSATTLIRIKERRRRSLIHLSLSYFDNSSILTIGFFAASRNSSFSSTVGHSYFSVL